MKHEIGSKQRTDKLLLSAELLIGTFSFMLFFIAIFVAIFIDMHPVCIGLVIFSGVACFLSGVYMCLKIEQLAGYYECPRCERRYIPKFSNVCFAAHFGRTRRMKCEHCGRISWHEKVLSQNPEDK